MRTQTTSQQDRNAAPPRDSGGNQPRAAKAGSKKTAPVAEMRAESPKPDKAPAPAQQPRPRKDENAGRRPVRFSYRNADAQSVTVAGSFNDWKPATRLMQRNGEWVAELELPPGTYEYRFVVDGQWLEDPAASAHATNPYGGRNSVIKV